MNSPIEYICDRGMSVLYVSKRDDGSINITRSEYAGPIGSLSASISVAPEFRRSLALAIDTERPKYELTDKGRRTVAKDGAR